MSRSIHTTWNDYFREKQYKYADRDRKHKSLDQMKKDLYDKRHTKKWVKFERTLKDTIFEINDDIDLSLLDIQRLDEGEYIHYIATNDDIIEVAKKLPRGVLLGINSINFCLGKQYHDENEDFADREDRDPFTGRICCENSGPLYTPPTLGLYYPHTCKIFLHAYVYDKNKVPQEIIHSFLRMSILATFIHEVAHHDDNMRRTRRGRWFGMNRWKCEGYAYQQQKEWTEKVLVPYLLERYPEEYSRLSSWIKVHGGTDISLVILVGEATGMKFSTLNSAIEELISDVANNKPSDEIKLAFAQNLHYGDYYEQCLEVLEGLLLESPSNVQVLGIKADTLIHMGKYNEAEATANACLQIDKNNIDALDSMCDVHMENRDWQALKHISQIGLEAIGDNNWKQRSFLEGRLLASLYLEDYEDVEKYLELYPVDRVQFSQRRQAFEALLLFKRGNSKEALNLTTRLLRQDDINPPARVILRAVHNKAIEELCVNNKKYELSKYDKLFLKNILIAELLDMKFLDREVKL